QHPARRGIVHAAQSRQLVVAIVGIHRAAREDVDARHEDRLVGALHQQHLDTLGGIARQDERGSGTWNGGRFVHSGLISHDGCSRVRATAGRRYHKVTCRYRGCHRLVGAGRRARPGTAAGNRRPDALRSAITTERGETMTGRLQDKVVIITGATSGIGEATARRFAAEGARLVLAGRSVDKGEALARELGGETVFQRTDVMRETDIAALVDKAVERFGRLDCLFNNAGAGERSSVESVTEEQFAEVMQLLVGSVVFGMKHAARVMKPQGGGSIINNSSI